MNDYTWEDFRNAGLLTLVLALLIAVTNIATAISMHGINHLQIDFEMLAIFVVATAIGSGLLYKAKRMVDEENAAMRLESAQLEG